jgi:Zn-dependent protease with chaperone function
MMKVPLPVMKVVTVGPALLASVVLTLAPLVLLPPAPRLVLFVASCGGLAALATGRLEGPAVQVLTRSREATGGEQQVLAPVLSRLGRHDVDVVAAYVRRAPQPTTPAAVVLGHGSLVVAPGLIDSVDRGDIAVEEAAAVIAHAVGSHRAGHHRCQVAVLVATTPWRVVGAVIRTVGNVFFRLPFVRAAWTLRGVIGVICVVQSVGEGRAAVGLLAGGVIALTYLMPAAARAQRQRLDIAGDIFVVERGLGEAPVASGWRGEPCAPARHG